jgi:hypothetical protein
MRSEMPRRRRQLRLVASQPTVAPAPVPPPLLTPQQRRMLIQYSIEAEKRFDAAEAEALADAEDDIAPVFPGDDVPRRRRR